MAYIESVEALEDMVNEAGLAPLFACGLSGFSVEERTPRSRWFVEGVEGPWEWREAAAARGNVFYGKFFQNRAGFVSRELLPDFCNFRREGYDFDTRYELGMAKEKSARIVRLLCENGSMRSGELRKAGGFGKKGESGFEGAVTSLMMQGYLGVSRFDYLLTKNGKPYGWGVSRYALLDELAGEEITRGRYDSEPCESFERLLVRMRRNCPGIGDDRLTAFLGGV